jgi:glycosyltransferase involved in cell wall biosynthesis
MSDAPLVTVAMPVHNGARWLAAAIDSVRAQSYRNLQIIISDNASTDDTPRICAAAAGDDARIEVVRHDELLPVWRNFDFGRTRKRGTYFMWAADDDLREPEHVARLVDALRSNPSATLAYSWTRMVDVDLQPIEILQGYDERIASADAAERVAAFAGHHYRVAIYGLMPAAAIDAVPPLSGRADDDGELLFRLALRGPFVAVREPLFIYRLRHSSDHYASFFQGRGGDRELARGAMYRRLIRESDLDAATKRRGVAAVNAALRDESAARYHWLVGELLRTYDRRAAALRTLASWIAQYPESLRSRFTWGAARRIALGRR